MRIGYQRVSTVDQNEARQLDGVAVEKMFTDKASGKDRNRPQLAACIEFAREGDTVLVHSLDRMGRNVNDLRDIIEELNAKGVTVEFVSQGLAFSGQDSPMSKLLLTMLGAVAEFELATIRERQAEGIAKAKAAGVYKGRKASLTDNQAAELVRRMDAGESVASLAREFGISRQSAYNYRKAALA
ncbi:recombinase family protein [Gordonia sp. NPDC003504]